MKTIVLERPEQLRFATVTAPRRPELAEALVRVRRVGVCGTDYHAYRGRQPYFTYPRVLGHELAVEVQSIGPGVEGIAAGDLCALLPYHSCGSCIACRHGKTNCCTSLSVLGVHTDGGLCEHLTVPAGLLHGSKRLTLDQLALVEPLGIGTHAVHRAAITPGEWALIIGAGPIGLATAQFALAAGARVIVADVRQERLDFCGWALGIEHCIQANDDVLEQISAITLKDLPTAVFDCTGTARSMADSFQFVAHGGRLVFVGLVQADISFNDPHFHGREITLLATRNSTPADFQSVIQAMESGRVNVAPWITHRCPFDAFIDTFPRWIEPDAGVIKGLVEL